MYGRFDTVAARFGDVYRLRLPRHAAVGAAFFASLDAEERYALDRLVSPFGVLEYFADGGLDRIARDGIDERLDCRFRRDPAELVNVLSGNSDGLHFGLWHDDPADVPTFIAYNWARDSAETWTHGYLSVVGQIYDWVQRAAGDDPSGANRYAPLEPVFDWFATVDAEAVAADGERRWSGASRTPCAISIGAALPSGSGDARADGSLRIEGAEADEIREWATTALAEAAAGRPAYALSLGAEMHWRDRPEWQDTARDLLESGYRAAGRDALAEIVRVHYIHRDLPDVGVLVPANGSP